MMDVLIDVLSRAHAFAVTNISTRVLCNGHYSVEAESPLAQPWLQSIVQWKTSNVARLKLSSVVEQGFS